MTQAKVSLSSAESEGKTITEGCIEVLYVKTCWNTRLHDRLKLNSGRTPRPRRRAMSEIVGQNSRPGGPLERTLYGPYVQDCCGNNKSKMLQKMDGRKFQDWNACLCTVRNNCSRYQDGFKEAQSQTLVGNINETTTPMLDQVLLKTQSSFLKKNRNMCQSRMFFMMTGGFDFKGWRGRNFRWRHRRMSPTLRKTWPRVRQMWTRKRFGPSRWGNSCDNSCREGTWL